jgi:predicted dehydrogenase
MADKPVAINDEQYERLKKVIDEGRIEVGLMLTMRFMSELHGIKELIKNETIGKLLSVEIFNPHRLMAHTRPDWHFEEELNGGIVVDLIVHSVDLYRWFTESEIDSYTGLKQKSILSEKKSFYDCAQFLVTSKTGTSGYFRVDWHMTDTHWNWGDMRVFLTGSKGCLEARCLGDPLTREPVVVLYEEGKETVRLNVNKYTQTVTGDFLNRINKKEYIIGHDDILAACRTSLDLSNAAKKYIID